MYIPNKGFISRLYETLKRQTTQQEKKGEQSTQMGISRKATRWVINTWKIQIKTAGNITLYQSHWR